MQYSAIMGLTNTNDPVIVDNTSLFGQFCKFINYFCFGVVTLVVPLKFIHIIKTACMLVTVPFTICITGATEKVERVFDRFICWLTGLKNNYQMKSLSFAESIVRVTFEDFIWLIIQGCILSGTLDVPELLEDDIMAAGLVISVLQTVSSLVTNLAMVWVTAHALDKEFLDCMMNMMTANFQWLPFET